MSPASHSNPLLPRSVSALTDARPRPRRATRALGLLGSWLLTLGVGLLPATPPPAHAQSSVLNHPLAVLIVGDETSKAMRAKEDDIVHRIRTLMREQGLPRELLPVLVYHLNKPAERAYCEQKLGIKRKDLLFVGLAEHDDMVVRRVLLRQSHVSEARQVVNTVFKKALEGLTGIDDPGQPESNPETTPSPGAGASPSPKVLPPAPKQRPDPSSAMRIDDATACKAVDNEGHPMLRCSSFTPNQALCVSAQAYGLEVGTEIVTTWYRNNTPIRQRRVLSNRKGDYYVWFRLEPEKRWEPGEYRVVYSLAGRPKATVVFRVSNS